MRRSRISRRWLIAGGVTAGTGVLVLLALGVLYPQIAAWKIRQVVGGKLAERLGREVKLGEVDVSLGRAVLRDVQVRGELDAAAPLVHVERAEIDFDTWASFVGDVRLGEARLDGVTVSVRRDRFGRDNVRDVLERLRARGGSGAGGGAGASAGGLGRLRPTKITITRARALADDELTGTTALVGDGDATWTPEQIVAHARKVSATTTAAPKASVDELEIRKMAGLAPIVTVEGGELALWPRLALSGIGGTIVANPERPGHYVLDLGGGYGGVPGRLWTARGDVDPDAATATIDLEAAKFQLERLAPILANTAVVDYGTTSVDTRMQLAIDRAGARFDGEFHLRGLNIGHPKLADKEVHGLDLAGHVAGTFDRGARSLALSRGDFVARNVPFSLTGSVALPPRLPREPAPGDPPPSPPLSRDQLGPHGIQTMRMRLVVPPVNCQRALEAIPSEMAPHMAGYRMKGMFDADVRLEIDWADLDATVLGGHVGIDHCRVVDEPADSPKRLVEPFEHYVEVEKGEWLAFVVGPDNPDFVPLDQISPYLIKSIMSTEDSGFYHHKGFIPSEFRTALISDLKARDFRHGASSITMQMVKNVLLYREKTLARKLQELFLTWYVEQVLTKDRILEIYFNVIEYGPALYGIGPAARHYFGKHPRDLNPVEAAFFSSILPNPKDRYKQYCQGTLTKWTTGKIERILAIMLKRERLTPYEYQAALATPLLFVKDGTENEKQCLDRVKKAIKNARPTNPLKK